MENDKPVCSNCGGELPLDVAVEGEAGGQPLVFCCEACRDDWFDAWADDTE